MSIAQHSFHNVNMYGFGGFGMSGGCCNPYVGNVVANLLYNPFMVFNTAEQLVNGNFPNLNLFQYSQFQYPQFQYSFAFPSYTYTMPSFGSFSNFSDSLYNGWMSPYFSAWNVTPSVDVASSIDFDSFCEKDKAEISNIFGLSAKPKSAEAEISKPSTFGTNVKAETSSDVKSATKTKSYNYIHEQIAGSHLTKEFLNKTKEVARNIGCDYEDLLAVMNSESTLNPKSEHKNKYGEVTAVGLIQFTRDAAIPDLNRRFGLNLTVAKIKNMSAIEQLDLVQKYYEMNRNRLPQGKKITAADLYAVTYLPARASKEVLCVKGEGNGYYESNRGLDTNKDGKITKEDLGRRLAKKRVSLQTFA